MEEIKPPGSKKLLVLCILTTSLISSLSAGFAVHMIKENDIKKLEGQVNSLQDIITMKEQEKCIERTEKADSTPVVTETQETSKTEEKYPAIFTPSGKFTQQEKTTLINKLVKPYFDYYQDSKNSNALDDIIAMKISKDDSTSNYYLVDVIFEDKSLQLEEGFGYMGFLFGSTRSEYSYWIPECSMEKCNISEEYRQKYPGVIQTFNACLPNACSVYYDY